MAMLTGSLTSPLLWAVLALVVTFFVALFFSGALRTAHFEAERGIASLCAMKWQDFAQLIGNFLGERGLRRRATDHRPGDGGFDLLLERGTSTYMVLCKNASGQSVNAQTIVELQKTMQHAEVEGAIVTSCGSTDATTMDLARSRGIEVIAGHALWRQLKHLLPFDVRDDAEAAAKREQRRRLVQAFGIALVAAVVTWVAVAALRPDTAAPATRPAASATRTPVAPTAAAPASTATGAATAPAAAAPPTAQATAPAATPSAPAVASAATSTASQMPDPTLDEAAVETRRATAAMEVRTLPSVEDAQWSTKSTLVVRLSGHETTVSDTVVADICRALLQYEEQRYSRLQLEIAPNDTGLTATGEVQPPTVRWRQCR